MSSTEFCLKLQVTIEDEKEKCLKTFVHASIDANERKRTMGRVEGENGERKYRVITGLLEGISMILKSRRGKRVKEEGMKVVLQISKISLLIWE